jgi:hypothetical protein
MMDWQKVDEGLFSHSGRSAHRLPMGSLFESSAKPSGPTLKRDFRRKSSESRNPKNSTYYKTPGPQFSPE